VKQEQEEIQEETEKLVSKDHREILDSLAKKVQLVHQEYQDHQDLKEMQVLLEKLDCPGLKVHQDWLVNQVLKVHLVYLVIQVPLVD